MLISMGDSHSSGSIQFGICVGSRLLDAQGKDALIALAELPKV